MTQSIRFGTDGVRGQAGQWPVSVDGAKAIGMGLSRWIKQGTVFVGRDTRASSPQLVDALVDGLVTGGAHAVRLGVVPTAAVSTAVVADGADAGVMVTASHNVWSDNGIKVVDRRGEKLVDPSELAAHFGVPAPNSGGTDSTHPSPLDSWFQALPSVDLSGHRILLDGAHGAGAAAAADALRRMGALVTEVANSPNGRNINDGVGAMHPPLDLHGCDLGICLDGDGDRLVLIHPHRGILDGDDLLWMLSRTSRGPVVGTVMCNGGLEDALAGRLVRTAVGDANVHAEMRRLNAEIGGEPSGHIMIRGGMPTSDGLYTALRILASQGSNELPIGGWSRWPQAKRNVRNVEACTTLDAIHEAEKSGHRVLVRASGTEPLVRIMVEGQDADRWAKAIEDALVRQMG